MEDGYAFPLGPKDAMLAAVSKNLNPGPGTHNLKSSLSEVNLRAHKTMGLPQPPAPYIDNGVPGPGAYTRESLDRIPTFKIMNE